MEHKNFRGTATVKSAPEGIAEVVVAAYGNLDFDGDIVLPGATSKQIAGQYGPRPKGLLDHDRSMRSAVAKTLDWWEADDGLHIQAQYNLDKQAGREAFSDLAFYGDDMQFSVGYSVRDTAPPSAEQRDARRVISEWQINEWSHVWLGANPATRLVSAKSADDEGPDWKMAELERLAAELGVTISPVTGVADGTSPGEGESMQGITDVMARRFRLLVATTRV